MRLVYFCWVACGLTITASVGAVLSAQNPNAGAASRQEAKSIFDGVCAGCHGLDGRGGERGPDVASRSTVVSRSDADLLGVIKDGRPSKGMPAFGGLVGTDGIWILVTYLKSLPVPDNKTQSWETQ